jgi:hypothetical protein
MYHVLHPSIIPCQSERGGLPPCILQLTHPTLLLRISRTRRCDRAFRPMPVPVSPVHAQGSVFASAFVHVEDWILV